MVSLCLNPHRSGVQRWIFTITYVQWLGLISFSAGYHLICDADAHCLERTSLGLENEAGLVLRLDRDPMHAGNRRWTYYKGEDFVRRGIAHANGRVFECMASDEETHKLTCRQTCQDIQSLS